MAGKRRKIEATPGTSKSSGITRRGSSNTRLMFENLPQDVLLEIFRKLPFVEVGKLVLQDDGPLLNEAVRTHFKYSLLDLRQSAKDTLGLLLVQLGDLSLSQDRLRIEIVKAITMVRYLATEIELMFATVWRFREDTTTWSALISHLAPVITEFNDALSSQRNSETLKPLLNAHAAEQMLPEWFSFLTRLKSGLETQLLEKSSVKTPFEIQAIDLLMCAPSINFQLGLKRVISGAPLYDVYGFFKTTVLKPVGQVPDVFNSQLTFGRKKTVLISYLRETVQRENIGFLLEQYMVITELEWAIAFSTSVNLSICDKLNERYADMRESPYSDVTVKYTYRPDQSLYEEFYARCSTENLSYTGLHCVILVPQRNAGDLPLSVPFLRGRRKTLGDFYRRVKASHSADFSNVFLPFNIHKTPGNSKFHGSNSKPKFQLTIHYRESMAKEPSEVVVNIGYDDEDNSYLTFHHLHGELFSGVGVSDQQIQVVLEQ